ncbi:hypothetical protein N8J89_00465 [Crossiella sp. CA-258035]|uniref:hypothetical protein n=1 Tax=Crossiella sp. CA-258035 TaxID=2981138 RepID=UPI0024BD3EA9|nr:hypothetical protein [Crossiella sp. CA-258035]WHT19606.1 hypothetical protein N8J89_00465 [Crossiella sp. CA-258035]
MATFVLVPDTGSKPDDWSELVADLEGRGDVCLLVDLAADRDQPQLCADRIAWAAQRSRTTPILVIHGDAAAHLPATLTRFRFAHVVHLTEDPDPDLAAHLARQARKAHATRHAATHAEPVGVRGPAPEWGLGAPPPV